MSWYRTRLSEPEGWLLWPVNPPLVRGGSAVRRAPGPAFGRAIVPLGVSERGPNDRRTVPWGRSLATIALEVSRATESDGRWTASGPRVVPFEKGRDVEHGSVERQGRRAAAARAVASLTVHPRKHSPEIVRKRPDAFAEGIARAPERAHLLSDQTGERPLAFDAPLDY